MRFKPNSRIAKPISVPMDTTGFRLPKPSPKVKGQPKDGRLIESPRQYRITKQGMWRDQHGRCAKVGCKNFMPTPAYGHRHHPGGRGLGGGKRDDSKTVLWCWECHKVEHGKKNKAA